MKKMLFSLAIFAFSASFCIAQVEKKAATTVTEVTEAATTDGPIMTFETMVVDYGVIEQGSDPLRQFKFINTGTEPLVIKHAKGSCGCTVPSYPKEPIMMGDSSTIDVRYDTKRIGRFTKTVTITTNETAERKVLRIKGEVKAKPKEPAAVPSTQPNILNNN